MCTFPNLFPYVRNFHNLYKRVLKLGDVSSKKMRKKKKNWESFQLRKIILDKITYRIHTLFVKIFFFLAFLWFWKINARDCNIYIHVYINFFLYKYTFFQFIWRNVAESRFNQKGARKVKVFVFDVILDGWNGRCFPGFDVFFFLFFFFLNYIFTRRRSIFWIVVFYKREFKNRF